MAKEDFRYFKRRKKKSKLHRFLRFLKGILYIILVILIFFSLLKFLQTSPYFTVENIEISGCKHYSKETIVEIFELNDNSNIFSIDLDQAREKLLEFPWIYDVKIKRNLLRTIEVEIIERIPTAIVAKNSSYFLIDKDNYVLEKTDEYLKKDLPIIKDLELEEINIGDKLDVYFLNEIVYIFNNLSDKMRKLQSYFTISKGLNISLFTEDNIEIIFGDSKNLAKKELVALELYKKCKNGMEKEQSEEQVQSEESFENQYKQLKVIDVRVWTNPITIP
jgi:cell division protein FtsQ